MRSPGKVSVAQGLLQIVKSRLLLPREIQVDQEATEVTGRLRLAFHYPLTLQIRCNPLGEAATVPMSTTTMVFGRVRHRLEDDEASHFLDSYIPLQ